MTRKTFIESQGATCRNWKWSWSFVNHTEKFVIFGAFDKFDDGKNALILSEDWSKLRGRKQPGFPQSREHIRLIEQEGYSLKTFPMKYGTVDPTDDKSIEKIKGITPQLFDKKLKKVGDSWYASEEGATSWSLPEELDSEEALKEGAARTISVNQYERNAIARKRCIAHHGYKCVVCSFDFEEAYGSIGKDFIHVHHILALADIGGEYEINPEADLVPICPNCHAMIHRTRPALNIEQLRQSLRTTK